MATLFEAAAGDANEISQLVDSMLQAAAEEGVALSANAVDFVQQISEDAQLRLILLKQLVEFAAAHGVDFVAEAPLAVETATAVLKALQNYTPSTPISQPIALLFIAASLLFAPSVFKTTGGTLYGDGTVAAVEGIVPF